MATTTDPAPAPGESAGPVHELPQGAGVYEYVGTQKKTYLFPGFPPQSAERGDVCDLPYDPGDGLWLAVKKKVTRLDDPATEAEKRRLEALALAPQDAVPAPVQSEQGAPASGKAA